MSDLSPQAAQDTHRPPQIPVAVCCRLCHESYQSYDIEWDEVRNAWRCATPDCGGVGFGVDILPVESEDPEGDDTLWVEAEASDPVEGLGDDLWEDNEEEEEEVEEENNFLILDDEGNDELRSLE